jgi:hypothetical protein
MIIGTIKTPVDPITRDVVQSPSFVSTATKDLREGLFLNHENSVSFSSIKAPDLSATLPPEVNLALLNSQTIASTGSGGKNEVLNDRPG